MLEEPCSGRQPEVEVVDQEAVDYAGVVDVQTLDGADLGRRRRHGHHRRPLLPPLLPERRRQLRSQAKARGVGI